MLKKSLIALAAIITFSGVAHAAPAEPKIVVVNIQRIMTESLAAKDLKSQLESKRTQYQAEIKTKTDKLKKQKEDLDKQQSVLSKDALTQKQKSFLADYKAAQDDANDKTVKFETAEKNASGEIFNAVKAIVEDMAKEQGFNLAIPHTQLLFATKDFDITDEILKRLDAKMPKATLKIDK